MLLQKQQPVISAGIGRGCELLRGAIYSILWASPTWKWASKELRITGKSCEGAHGPELSPSFQLVKDYWPLTCKIWAIHKTLLSLNFGFEFTAVHFLILIPLSGHVSRISILNAPAGLHRSWWQSLALQAGRPIVTLCQASLYTAMPLRKGLNCLFTICCGNPQFFIEINNWAVLLLSSRRGLRQRMPEQHEGDTHTPAWQRSWSSPPFLCSCCSLSGLHLLFVCKVQHSCHHVQRATCLCLLGPSTNSRSLAPIELMFLFRGSYLVSLSLRFTLATLLSSRNRHSRLLRSDQSLVSLCGT